MNARKPRKPALTVNIDADLQRSLRATVAGLQRSDPHLTLAGFVTDALHNHVRWAEREHNAGEPFELVDRQLRTGPRVGSAPGDSDGHVSHASPDVSPRTSPRESQHGS